ncbi:hypothetical protein N7481_006111 [Penicillium waksmanii]|uniref:uncharacterized protein n=1 Tax=Penicillium waksmanii TaxID=69791 RepID=UPI0025474BC7|nr:uncharacterized protein N7481_006111 [Penicillium waksmanii]KAJ5984012.1 hypothetical protein N7481_006111 [Penicillium waksmanii]
MMFEDLPPEILHLVSHHLNNNDIFHLICLSRRLYTIIQQNLYAEVFLCGRNHSSQQVVTFLYAVTRDPRLASYVRCLWLGDWDCGDGIIHLDKAELDSGYLLKLVSERTGYSEEERSKWLKDLEKGDDCDPWLALLILQLKDLRKILINWAYDAKYVLDMLRKAAREQEPVFRHLEEVYATWWDDTEGSIPSHRMTSFFSFPSVRKVGCCCLGEDYDSDDDEYDSDNYDSDDSIHLRLEVPLPQSSNITHLDLANSNAGNGMRDWVQACKVLKSFRLIHHGTLGRGRLYESLSLHKTTLESVWAEPDEGVYIEEQDDWMGSFADFPVLKTICLLVPNLVGFDENKRPMRKLLDVLPHSLETLYLIINREGNGLLDAMEQLVELASAEKFPNLAAIHIEARGIQSPKSHSKLQGTKRACEEAGKSFFIHGGEGFFTYCDKPTSWVFGPVNEATLLGYY